MARQAADLRAGHALAARGPASGAGARVRAARVRPRVLYFWSRAAGDRRQGPVKPRRRSRCRCTINNPAATETLLHRQQPTIVQPPFPLRTTGGNGMPQENQHEEPLEEAGGYGTPTAEQEMPHGGTEEQVSAENASTDPGF